MYLACNASYNISYSVCVGKQNMKMSTILGSFVLCVWSHFVSFHVFMPFDNPFACHAVTLIGPFVWLEGESYSNNPYRPWVASYHKKRPDRTVGKTPLPFVTTELKLKPTKKQQPMGRGNTSGLVLTPPRVPCHQHRTLSMSSFFFSSSSLDMCARPELMQLSSQLWLFKWFYAGNFPEGPFSAWRQCDRMAPHNRTKQDP